MRSKLKVAHRCARHHIAQSENPKQFVRAQIKQVRCTYILGTTTHLQDGLLCTGLTRGGLHLCLLLHARGAVERKVLLGPARPTHATGHLRIGTRGAWLSEIIKSDLRINGDETADSLRFGTRVGRGTGKNRRKEACAGGKGGRCAIPVTPESIRPDCIMTIPGAEMPRFPIASAPVTKFAAAAPETAQALRCKEGRLMI